MKCYICGSKDIVTIFTTLSGKKHYYCKKCAGNAYYKSSKTKRGEEEMKDIDELMKIAIKEQYKELCDKIKIEMLNILEGLIVMKPKEKRYITFNELEYIRQKLDEVRSKEHEKEMRAIGGVISMILNRTDDELINQPKKEKKQ